MWSRIASRRICRRDAGSPLIRVHSGAERPGDEFVAVSYRGTWYWVADTDLRSKRMFTILVLLFSLVETGDGEPRRPGAHDSCRVGRTMPCVAGGVNLEVVDSGRLAVVGSVAGGWGLSVETPPGLPVCIASAPGRGKCASDGRYHSIPRSRIGRTPPPAPRPSPDPSIPRRSPGFACGVTSRQGPLR